MHVRGVHDSSGVFADGANGSGGALLELHLARELTYTSYNIYKTHITCKEIKKLNLKDCFNLYIKLKN